MNRAIPASADAKNETLLRCDVLAQQPRIGDVHSGTLKRISRRNLPIGPAQVHDV